MLTRFDAIMGQELREPQFNHITPEVIVFALDRYEAQIEDIKRRARAQPGTQYSVNFHITHWDIAQAQARPGRLGVLYGHMHLRPEWTLCGGGGSAAAEAKSIELLKSWLDPAQLASYNVHQYFAVRGNDSGKWYRLVEERSYNILELSGRSKEPNGNKFCVVPGQSVAMGDQLLAQKIWIETDETKTLAIANKISRNSSGHTIEMITRQALELFYQTNRFF